MATAPVGLERRITTTTLILLVFGHVMLFSATGVLGLQNQNSEFYYLSAQFTGAALGLALMFLFSKVRYQFLGRIAPILMATQIVLTTMAFIPGFAHSAQGVNRWISLGFMKFQPSEVAKITLMIYVCQILALKDNVAFTPKRKLLSILPILLLLGLIFKQPDLGSTILLSVTIIAVLFIAGARPIYVMGFLGIGILGFALSLINSDYRQRRVMAFLNPWADPQGGGFQSIQSFLSFYSGKIFGVGLGNGNSKLFYLPEVHTDFIFALVGEELGFVGAFALMCTFAYLGYLLFKIVRFAPDLFGRYLAFTLSLSLLLQIVVNLGGVTGVIPVKGLPLPFISWGRSALVVNLAMMGILLNICKQALPPTPEKQTGRNSAQDSEKNDRR
ncbi:MAG: putative lipid II flippase FtsW [Bdellovibrionales bacterium]|nr:putative lipid II flippase FtsW [Bdellovibrionales bacterium]